MAVSENGSWPGCVMSSALRVRSDAAATRTPAAATARNAARQPAKSDKAGRIAPASAAPAGTPVCLIENVSAMRSGGVVRASTSDEAAVIGPYPNPMKIAVAARRGAA